MLFILFFFFASIVKTGGKRVDHTVLPKLTSKIKENGFFFDNPSFVSVFFLNLNRLCFRFWETQLDRGPEPPQSGAEGPYGLPFFHPS